jgi:bile acid:Na+ symporter, BASS family
MRQALAPLVFLLLMSTAAWFWPALFVPLKPAIVPGLGIIMFAMGTTLSPGQIFAVMVRPRWLVVGVALQFMIMPLVAWGLAISLDLSAALAAGLILVGSCPGGTASNLMVYLGRGNLALSVAMTAVSTLLAPVATPWLTHWLVGERIEIPVREIFYSMVAVVLLPVSLGMVARAVFRRWMAGVARTLPLVSLVVIGLIVATVVALSRDNLTLLAPTVIIAVMLHNGFGLLLGYGAALAAGAGLADRRAIALEVGMQNSGLAAALAIKFLPIAAVLPAAAFSLWHNLSALSLIAVWRAGDSGETRG